MHRLYGAWCYISSLFILVVIVYWLNQLYHADTIPFRLQRYTFLGKYASVIGCLIIQMGSLVP